MAHAAEASRWSRDFVHDDVIGWISIKPTTKIRMRDEVLGMQNKGINLLREWKGKCANMRLAPTKCFDNGNLSMEIAPLQRDVANNLLT